MFSRSFQRNETQSNDLLTNPQTMDYKKLLLLLYESVLHHDFDRSGSIVEAITAWPFRGGEIPIKMSKEAMLQDHSKEALPDVLKVYKQVFVLSDKFKIENMLDIVFLLLSHNEYEEGYQTLLRSVNADPFNSSPLCHGYAGLLAYIFWCKETNLDSKTEFELRSNNDDGTNSVVSGLSDVYPKIENNTSQLIIKHFSKLMKLLLKPNTEYKGNYDLFVHYFWRSLVMMGRHKVALDVIKEYRALYPFSINALKMNLTHLTNFGEGRKNNKAITKTRRSLAIIDPSDCAVIDLIEETIEGSDYESAFKLLVQFLDYPHNQYNTKAWDLLRIVTEKWREYRHSCLWLSRARWWGKLYRDQLKDIL